MLEGTSASTTEALDVPSTQFRDFAAECVELARKTPSLEKRVVYLKMVSVLHQTALHWEKSHQPDETCVTNREQVLAY